MEGLKARRGRIMKWCGREKQEKERKNGRTTSRRARELGSSIDVVGSSLYVLDWSAKRFCVWEGRKTHFSPLDPANPLLSPVTAAPTGCEIARTHSHSCLYLGSKFASPPVLLLHRYVPPRFSGDEVDLGTM
jgi:hypothetical protein